jgi:hypothetical protein
MIQEISQRIYGTAALICFASTTAELTGEIEDIVTRVTAPR